MSPSRPIFELRDQDAAGRIGALTVPGRGITVETPALMPVVNPHVQTVPPSVLQRRFGAEIIITNAYILHRSDEHREAVLDRGLHGVLDFSGAIMTDSGSFQLSEYGSIDVGSRQILDFQRAIGSDIATPVDLPTPPDVDRHRAVGELAITQRRIREAAAFDAGDMLLTAPIQGATYPSLRTVAARYAYDSGLDLFPIGAVVPLLNDYRFADMVDVIAAAKRGLGSDAPVHLFGAGHPMMFALAVAMGCDLFDSAAYALYARDGRYLTARGTRHLEDLRDFPCACPICTEHTPEGLAEHAERERLLSEHNLYVTFAEMRRVKEAIREGSLLELVEERARAHPAVLDGYRRMLTDVERLERRDPATKGTFFYLSSESARRPEVVRHRRRLSRLACPDRLLLVDDRGEDPDGSGPFPNGSYDERWSVIPPFGPVPPELVETYPVNAERPTRTDRDAYAAAADGIMTLLDTNPRAAIDVVLDGWPTSALRALPDAVERHRIASEPTDSSTTPSDVDS